MKRITVNREGLEYDIHSLVKAFYPAEDVRVLGPESVIKDKAILEEPADMELVIDADQSVLKILPDKLPSETEEADQSSAAGAARAQYVLPGAFEKHAFKLFLYDILAKRTGRTLPWGNLTGIRPTKIAMTMMDEGKTEEEIRNFLRGQHKVSEEKIELSLDIARREKKMLQALHCGDGYSVYIGIPFCPTTCLYCSFTSFPICAWNERVGEYLDALRKELRYTAEAFRDKILDTVYIGGGTPTSLSAEDLDRLLSMVKETLDFSQVMEFTVEAGRADSITREKLQIMKQHGVSRISVNPQTMNQRTLDYIGRRHSTEQVKEAFAMARQEGFDNINMDIILGLPGESPEDVSHTIAEIKRMAPDSLTVHSLAVKRASKLASWIKENGIDALKNTEETMEIARQGALDMGMKPYYLYRQKNMSGNFENVGYARENAEGVSMGCIYNSAIMEEVQTIVALGAGSISKRVYPDGRIERCDNVKDINGYIERIDEMIERKKKLFSD